MEFGKRLQALRKEKRMTQEQLAKRLGLTKSVVSAYETGMRCPSYDVLIRLSGILNVSTDFLLGVDDMRTLRLDGLTEQEATLITEIVDVLKGIRRS